MEEKINNQKIFFYVPPIVAKLIIDSDLKDSDVFFNNSNNNNTQNNSPNQTLTNGSSKKKSPIKKVKSKKFIIGSTLRRDSGFVKPNVFPISHVIEYSLAMFIRFKGFERLIHSLIIKDKENKKEKLNSEYISMIISRLILKISGILSENGGEIVKYNDFEILVLWNFSNAPLNKILKYKKFYAKYALISAIEIMKKFDDSEIFGTKIEISIGMGMGDCNIIFFGGERKRSEYVVFGEAIEQAEICIENCLEHEIIISKEINNLFKIGQELTTRELKNEFDHKSYFAVDDLIEETIKNFEAYRGLKLNNTNIYMNKAIYENLSKKIYILSSILPQGLIKYLDVGNEENLKEISTLTVETIQVSISLDLIDDLTFIQNLIFDIQKATYMTFGSLLFINKTYNGFLIKCVWGIDPGNFIDNPARAISTAILIGSLTNYYNIKLGIGITTGACFSGLINVQGNRKLFSLMGKKVNLSRTLADEALASVFKSDLNYLIYCDKFTMKHSQKNYRQSFVSKIKTYFDKEEDLYYEFRDDFFTGIKNSMIKKQEKRKNFDIFKKRRKTRREIVKDKNKSIDNKDLTNKSETSNKYQINDKKNKLIQEIFSPIENDEFFVPNVNDPFPLIRTHLYNSFNPMNKIINLNYMNPKTQIKNFIMTCQKKEENMTEKSLKKLKKSQTIFGYSEEIKKIIYIINEVIKKNKKQFIAIKGPPGVGKSLFLRKALNNFIGLNDKLNQIYFGDKEFLFCNLINPFTATLPYNTVSFILRKIYFHLLKYNLMKELYQNTKNLILDEEDLEHISYILSIGKKDINVKEDFDIINNEEKTKETDKQTEEEKKNEETKIVKETFFSVIAKLEGPYNYKNSDKLNMFFYEIIKIYKKFLNKSLSNNKQNNKFIYPLIFVIEDVHNSNNYAFEFIQFLFLNKDTSLNPFIVILSQQTPMHFEHNSFSINKSVEQFITNLSDYSSDINQDKILAINIKPLSDKKQLEKLIVFYFKDLVLNNYKTNLEKVDDQILDFLLSKSFNGIPLLVISLFKSLIKSEKFIQTLSAEFIITSDLIDDNKTLDWSDILLPYEYEKFCSMKINSFLNFRETLIFKYACILGTIFDLQILDKLNPLYSIIKMTDLKNVVDKLDKEHIIEIFSYLKNKDKREYIFCKISFPFMREVFQQKFPIEYLKILHMKAAKIISTDKKINFFSTENNILSLQRHLIISEMDLIKEIESKKIETLKDMMQNRQALNYNNMKILLVKELYSRFCYPTSNHILEGNLELLLKSKWLRISYYIDLKGKIYFNQKDFQKGTLKNILIFSIEKIYKNHILKNVDENKYKCLNVLEISVSTTTRAMEKNNKKIYYLRSEQREELSKLDIAINFLRVKVNYEKFVSFYGELKFPIYRIKWFVKKKVNKYYANIESRKMNRRNSINKLNISYTDNILTESNNYFQSFTILINTTLSIFLGTIQENILKNPNIERKKDEQDNMIAFPKRKITYNFLKYFTIPQHLSHKMNKYLKKLELNGIIKNRPDNFSFEDSLYERIIQKMDENKNKSKKKKKSKSKKSKKKKNKASSSKKKKDSDFNSEDEISFSDSNSDSKKNKFGPSSSISDENSFNSILQELLQNKKVCIENATSRNRNSKYPKIMFKNLLNLEDKISFPGDFVPLTERTEDRSHIKYVDLRKNKINERHHLKNVYNFDIGSLMSNSDINLIKKELKYKTLSDDPKYVYLEENKKNVKNKKVHKSGLFMEIKHNND